MPDNQPINPEEQIFEEALKIEDQEKRCAFLDGACLGDQGLRAQLHAMLEAHEGADGFLDTLPEDKTLLDESIGECAGSQIGRYKLLEQIGQGGMGTVYLAEQREPFVKRVALKIIKLGMDTKAVVARFQAEQQALALMNHPSIAKVLDGGSTETGRPYFVMELVKGIPITEYCDKHKLSTEQRLELFIPVCQAVQHAHQKGIIHRDIKPSNVLVAHMDGKPLPMVIDFGIAKATNQRLTQDTYFTEHGRVIGTMEYMSPEQAEGSQLDIDTLADIYSLGVLLYQLLTGSTPFPAKRLQKSGFREMMRIIQEEEPQRPSLRISSMTEEERTRFVPHHPEGVGRTELILRQELDWVLIACLEKDRSKRYETANALAMELERYLSGEPIQKRPPGGGYQLRKLIRKHKRAFAMAAAIAVILGVSAVTSTVLWRKAVDAETLATTRAGRLAAFNDWMTRHLLPQVDAWTGFEAGQNRNANIKLKDAILQSVKTLSEDFKDQPEIEGEIRLTVGKAFQSMGEMEAARENFERAYELLKQSVGETHTNTISVQFELGRALAVGEEFNPMSPSAREAVSLMSESFESAVTILGETNAYSLNAGLIFGSTLLKFSSGPGSRKLDDVIPEMTAAGLHQKGSDMIAKCAGYLGLPRDRTENYPLDLWVQGGQMLCQLRIKQGRIPEAVELLDFLYEETCDYPSLVKDVRYAMGVLQPRAFICSKNWRRNYLEAARDSDLALSISRQSVERGQPTPRILETRAMLEMDLGNLDRARGFLIESMKYHVDELGTTHEQNRWRALRLLSISASRADWDTMYEDAQFVRGELGITNAMLLSGEIAASVLSSSTNHLNHIRNLYFDSLEYPDNFWNETKSLALMSVPCPPEAIPRLELAVRAYFERFGEFPFFKYGRLGYNRLGEKLLGALAYRKGEHDTARIHLEAVLDGVDDRFSELPASYLLAMTLHGLKEFEAARKELSLANDTCENYIRFGWFGRAVTQIAWEKFVRALILREEAEIVIRGRAVSERINPTVLANRGAGADNMHSLIESGYMQMRERNYGMAVELFEEAMRLPGFNWEVANWSYRGGPYGSTQFLFTKALFTAYWATGRSEEHIKVLQKFHGRLKDNSAWLYALAELPGPLPDDLEIRRTGSPERISLEDQWRSNRKSMVSGKRFLLGMLAYRGTNYSKAIEALKIPMRSDSYVEPVAAAAFSAMAHWRSGELGTARVLLRACLKKRTGLGCS